MLTALDQGLARAGYLRDDAQGDLVHVPIVRAGESWWASMPSSLLVGPVRFLVFLAFDPDNEWGAPIGYDVRPVEDREGTPHFGPAERQVREETHPDDGAYQGALAEIVRRTGAEIEEEDFDEVGVVFP